MADTAGKNNFEEQLQCYQGLASIKERLVLIKTMPRTSLHNAAFLSYKPENFELLAPQRLYITTANYQLLLDSSEL